MDDNVIFCKSLLDAFVHVGMTFPSGAPEPGKLLRFPTNGKAGDTAGWCKLFSDGVGAVFGCHRDGSKYTWQMRDTNTPQSRQTRQAAYAQSEQTRQRAAREHATQQANAADTAARILRDTVELDPAHGYVARKGITPYGARQDVDGMVTLPVYGSDEALQSLQFINADGTKRFLRHGKMKGGRLFVGKPVDGLPLVLVEGWATGCSIHEAVGQTVVIGFSGSNLSAVAADLRRRFPNSPLQLAGDLDAHGKGFEYAQAAAAAGAPAIVLLPSFADGRDRGDYNDLHQAEGLDAVRHQLAAVTDTSDRAVVPFMEPFMPTCDARDGTRDSRPLTEFGNAQRLFDSNGERLRYVHDAQSWLVWHGGAWQWDAGSGVRSLAVHLPASIYGEGARHLNDAEHFGKWARKSQEHRVVNAAVAMLADFASLRLPLDNIDADHLNIGFDHARQVIDLRNGSIRPARTSDYITKSLSGEAIGHAGKATRWMQFLEQVFSDDQELIDWMQRFCGYLLTGSTQEQLFLFCFGHGANGKSVFIEVLKHVMGDYSRAIASETLSESKRQAGGATPDLAALIGARLVICSETEDNTALAESLVKSLVSGDSMAVRQLYAAPVQFTPNFKLMMAGNHKPIVRGNDNGIWRRVRLVPFNRTFTPEERDPHLLAKLKAETPHILAWMVHGCIEWQRRGLADTPVAVRQATDAYQVDQDLIGAWLSECTSSSVHAETAAGDLYANYKAWCIDNGLRAASAVALGRRLTERGYRVRQSHGKRLWCGLILTDSRHDDYARVKGGY
jgi:P4 family phage/plasmid primase-like protien